MIDNLTVHLTLRSGNAKTGPIPVSTTTMASCPATCPMASACYAKHGKQAIHWRKVTSGERGADWATFCAAVAKIRPGQLWRHNVSGDLPHAYGAIDRASLEALVAANAGKRGFTYSHHIVRGNSRIAAWNRLRIKRATRAGFTINASCETLQQADEAIANGMHAVAVVPHDEARTHWRSPAGNPVRVCPAQIADGVTCATCGLCQDRPQHHVVAFRAHGPIRKAAAAIAQASA